MIKSIHTSAYSKDYKTILVLTLALLSTTILSAQGNFVMHGGSKVQIKKNSVLKLKTNVELKDHSKLDNEGEVYISGNIQNNSLEFQELRKGVVHLNGSLNQSISGHPHFNQVHINNPNGVSINADGVRIYHTLFLDQGALQTGDSLVFNSDAIRTARLNEITAGSISGDIIMERFVDSTAYDWRFLSMPVQNASANEYMDDIIITGIPNSHYPNFNFSSISYYDESMPGIGNIGFVIPSDINSLIPHGKGLNVYAGNQNLTVDAKGEAYTGSFNFGISYTDDVATASHHEGWNLIGNPYPSAIDWDASNWTKTNVDNAIYVYSGELGQYTSYVGGVSTNGGSRYIASSQSFWVKANNLSPSLISSESVKTMEDPDFIESSPDDLLRLQVSNSYSSDETVIRFNNNATELFDANYDAIKFLSGSAVPSLASTWDSLQYSINALPENQFNYEIPLFTSVVSNGTYDFSLTAIPIHTGGQCFHLYDKKIDTIYPLALFQNISVQIDTSDATDRFVLFAGPAFKVKTVDNLCHGSQLGAIQIQSSLKGNWNYWISDDNGQLIGNGLVTSLQMLNIDSLSGGDYQLKLIHSLACDTLRMNVNILEPTALSIAALQTRDSIKGGFHLSADISGGITPYQIQWSDTTLGNSSNVYVNSTSIFTITATDINGCIETHTFNITLVDIDEVSQAQFNLYPNPSRGKIYLKTDMTEYTLSVLSMNGQLLETISNLNQSLELDLSHFAAGVYFIEINDKSSFIRKKLVLTD